MTGLWSQIERYPDSPEPPLSAVGDQLIASIHHIGPELPAASVEFGADQPVRGDHHIAMRGEFRGDIPAPENIRARPAGAVQKDQGRAGNGAGGRQGNTVLAQWHRAGRALRATGLGHGSAEAGGGCQP